MRVLYLLVGFLALVVPSLAMSGSDEILVMSASEDAGGATSADFDLPVLKMFERRSVEMLESRIRSILAAQGQLSEMPKLKAEAHYVDSSGHKLAVVRIKSPKLVNQVFVYGIKGDMLYRVACARTSSFDQPIPLFYGSCGDKLREVFALRAQ